ncbi:PASTA domain-containing protein [Sphingobacterium sp. E70]|nr:PASTA domain-containing protein [Sphingobacterium sp. E70]
MVYANDMEMQGKKSFKAVNVGGRMPLTLQGSREASKKVYDKLGINTVNWDMVARGEVDTSNRGVPFVDLKYKEGIVPNVVGMGLMDALYVMENAGFKTHVFGKGRVGAQSLTAGQKLPFGTAINLELK